MIDKTQLKLFVQKTLGCNCPEEVFEHIDCRADVNLDAEIALDYEINIGNRLLIFAASIDQADSIRPILSQLVRAGIKKRDREGFNRFRLVLLTKRPGRLAKEAFEVFDSLGVDEKAHLHVIRRLPDM
ncbi:MAG: hypothetical protein ISS79_13600 [Phycisphaerae bacterium]|nr:hypothetical protein [Phycisphaerae bacterium]